MHPCMIFYIEFTHHFVTKFTGNFFNLKLLVILPKIPFHNIMYFYPMPLQRTPLSKAFVANITHLTLDAVMDT